MKSKPICILLGCLTLVTILVITPSAFAAQTVEVTITIGSGASQNVACVLTHDCFTPNPVQITKGDTVKWTNTDSSVHVVESGKLTDNDTAGTLFNSGSQPLKKGETYSYTFNNPGTYDYFDFIHPWMTGQVIVASTTSTPTTNTTGNNTVPEFGSIAPIVLVIAIISVIAVTAKSRGFLKL